MKQAQSIFKVRKLVLEIWLIALIIGVIGLFTHLTILYLLGSAMIVGVILYVYFKTPKEKRKLWQLLLDILIFMP